MKSYVQNILCLFISAILLNHCGLDHTVDSGGASETIAIVVTDSMIYGEATIVTEDGDSAIEGLDVKLYACDYLPFFPNTPNNFYDSILSDENGEFRFSNINTGCYNIFAANTLTGKSVFIDSIVISADVNDTVYDSLTVPGGISGNVYSISGSTGDTSAAALYSVFAFGAQFFVNTDFNGAFLLDSIPRGYYTFYSAPIDSILNSSDSVSTDFIVGYITMTNELPKIDTVQSGEVLGGKEIYLRN